MKTKSFALRMRSLIRFAMTTTLFVVTAILLSSCAGVTPSDYANAKPKLVFEEYFDGELQAWGMFMDRGGKVVRRFTVDIRGTWNDNKGKLVEDFVFADGEKEQRIWNVTRNADGSYTATADDVVGPARGEANGNSLNWKYTLSLPVDDSVYEVELNDWMFLVNEEVLINRAVMTKFGFRVGEVLITFKRKEKTT